MARAVLLVRVEGSASERLVVKRPEDHAVSQADIVDLVAGAGAVDLVPVAVFGAALLVQSVQQQRHERRQAWADAVTGEQRVLQLVFAHHVL